MGADLKLRPLSLKFRVGTREIMQRLIIAIGMCLYTIQLNGTSNYAIASGILGDTDSVAKFYKEKNYSAPQRVQQIAKQYKATEFFDFLNKLENTIKDPHILNKIAKLSQCKLKPHKFYISTLSHAHFKQINATELTKKYNVNSSQLVNSIQKNIANHLYQVAKKEGLEIDEPINSKFFCESKDIEERLTHHLPSSFCLIKSTSHASNPRVCFLEQMYVFGYINEKIHLQPVAGPYAYSYGYISKKQTLLIPVATLTFAEFKASAYQLAYPTKICTGGMYKLKIAIEPTHNKKVNMLDRLI